MLEAFSNLIARIDGAVWGPVMLVILVGTGIYLTLRTKFLVWRNLPFSIHSTLSKEARQTDSGSGDVSPFASLCTALAATIGTGNIAGVASALDRVHWFGCGFLPDLASLLNLRSVHWQQNIAYTTKREKFSAAPWYLWSAAFPKCMARKP